ncbi:MAG: SRPBCC domain-containing protein [Gemmatimonadales bacterium]
MLERTCAATVRELWDLWTTKDGFESWWAPAGFRARVHSVDARLDGELRFEMIAEAPETAAALQARERAQPIRGGPGSPSSVPSSELVLRHLVDFVPDVPTYESTLIVDFSPKGAGTRMVVTLMAMHSPDFTAMASAGLEGQLANLDRLFPTPR